jgi:hypothetical protein
MAALFFLPDTGSTSTRMDAAATEFSEKKLKEKRVWSTLNT